MRARLAHESRLHNPHSMPREARWFIKTSLLYLVLALAAGVVLAWPASRGFAPSLYPTYLHLFTVGWLTQLIFGVAFWLFPRHSREQPYGRRALVWASYGCLNVGLLLRAATEPFAGQEAFGRWSLVVAALLQWLGGLLFVIHLWPRVKTK